MGEQRAEVEILAPGAYASLQDRGRRGYRRIGVPWAGVLDPALMRIANTLVGNAENTAVIECFDGGLQIAARGAPVRVAVAGAAGMEVESAAVRRPAAPWRSLRLDADEVLRIRQVEQGRVVIVAVAGLQAEQVMGSASTYGRAGLGGVEGRALAAGMRLAAAPHPGGPERVLPVPPVVAVDAPIRAVPGPQADYFAAEVLAAFAAAEYCVSTEADRMGMRLDGPMLEHLGAREIVSDATVPGSIQVPGNGRPIVLLADGQTAGGYPKIATVIGADLPRLATRRAGERIRFALVTAEEGERLARAAEAELRALLASVRPLIGEGVDSAALYSVNLVGGVVHALTAE